jgi:hypothetical protein
MHGLATADKPAGAERSGGAFEDVRCPVYQLIHHMLALTEAQRRRPDARF